ncbi:MAG: C25 family cysteine peptidase, partial [Promethearchaeota archaeon]
MARRTYYLSVLILISLIFISSLQINLGVSQSELSDNTKTLNPARIDEIISALPRYTIEQNESDWLPDQYEMLLISPDNASFIDAANVFAEWKREIGIPALVVANWSDYEGIDGPEKIRNAIISYYNKYPIKWVLLLGDTEIIPIRYAYNPDCQLVGDSEPVGDQYKKPTDYYYAELTSDWDIDDDGKWGEHSTYNSASDVPELDYSPEVYVGRFPVDNVYELYNVFNKTMNYEQGKYAGEWMHKYLALSGVSDYPASSDLDGEDEAIINQYILDNYVNDSMDWIHMMDYTSFYTPEDSDNVKNLSKTAALAAINNGTSIITYAGHGSPSRFSASSVLTTSDVPNLSNTNKPSFIFADACSTNSYDYDCLGEDLIKQPNTGAIGYIGSMRLSWYYPNDTALEADNRGLTKLYFKEMFNNGEFQQGKALYESKKAYVNSHWFKSLLPNYTYFEMERKSILSYMLLGDPSLYIYTDKAGSFSPLFPEDMVAYEGSKYEVQLKSDSDTPIRDTKLTLRSEDGLYRVFSSDDEGIITFILPLGNRTFDYSLFAHNMIYRNGSFKVDIDNKAPMIKKTETTPINPKATNNITFNTTINDYGLGICYGYLVLSTNDFENFSYYPLIPRFNSCEYDVTLKLREGNHQYGIVSFDYMNNYNTTLYNGTMYLDISPAT